MIIGIGDRMDSRCAINFGTHNGIFHSDDVLSAAILELAFIFADAYLVRTRDPEVLKKLNIVFDIGGGEFDHHMKGFCLCRHSGEMYASAGLIWKSYGEIAIRNVMKLSRLSVKDDDIKSILEQIDQEIIIPVDQEDNGVDVGVHTFSFISKFLPSWVDVADYDSSFRKAESVVYSILRELIRDKIVQVITKDELKKRFYHVTDGILEIPSQTMPWLEEVVRYNEYNSKKIYFVVFQYPAGGWAAQCVPPSVAEKFKQLKAFPKEWAGGNAETLPGISGIKDATFCHNGAFFARARTKKAILQMCKVAMK